jgi:hypothetical protein
MRDHLMKDAGYPEAKNTNCTRYTYVKRIVDLGCSDGNIMKRTGHRSSTIIEQLPTIEESMHPMQMPLLEL